MKPMNFELDRLVSNDDASLLAELKRVAATLDPGQPLTKSAFEARAKVHPETVTRRFGGWRQALGAAGLGDRYSGRTVSDRMRAQGAKALSDDELVAEMRRVAAGLGTDTLTAEAFDDTAAVSSAAIQSRFGSWKAGLERAGLRQSNLSHRWTEQDYFENLLRVWTLYGRAPKCSGMDRPPSKITAGAYKKRWGTWTKAQLAFIQSIEAQGATAKVRASARTRTAAVLDPEDRHGIPLGLRYRVMKRDGFRCAICGVSPATTPGCVLHVDHVVPFSKGGKTVFDNLRTLCEPCNLGRGNESNRG
jgi:hypothetical protein